MFNSGNFDIVNAIIAAGKTEYDDTELRSIISDVAKTDGMLEFLVANGIKRPNDLYQWVLEDFVGTPLPSFFPPFPHRSMLLFPPPYHTFAPIKKCT